MADLEQFTRTYTSFSGADIKCVFGDTYILECQGISFSVTREKAPIYVLGSANPISFNRGKRGIAGSFIFTMIGRDPLAYIAAAQNNAAKSQGTQSFGYYYAKYGEVSNPDNYMSDITTINDAQKTGTTGINLNVYKVPVIHPDQLLPFDITITAANEYGQVSVLRIYGVEILNIGSGISVDDIVTEQQATFIAREIGSWTVVQTDNKSTFDTFSLAKETLARGIEGRAQLLKDIKGITPTESVGVGAGGK